MPKTQRSGLGAGCRLRPWGDAAFWLGIWIPCLKGPPSKGPQACFSGGFRQKVSGKQEILPGRVLPSLPKFFPKSAKARRFGLGAGSRLRPWMLRPGWGSGSRVKHQRHGPRPRADQKLGPGDSQTAASCQAGRFKQAPQRPPRQEHRQGPPPLDAASWLGIWISPGLQGQTGGLGQGGDSGGQGRVGPFRQDLPGRASQAWSPGLGASGPGNTTTAGTSQKEVAMFCPKVWGISF